MDASERLGTKLPTYVEACRAHYLRMKDAGSNVTDEERAEARIIYFAALERLSRFLARQRTQSSTGSLSFLRAIEEV